MTVGSHGGPSLPQQRRLATAIPGPRSQQLLARPTPRGWWC